MSRSCSLSHRPRSHSVSISPSTQEDSWRIATKRAHPHQTLTRDQSLSPKKRDVEVWRSGKRVRRSIDNPSFETAPTSDHSDTLSAGSGSHRQTLPSTSADFNLYPERNKRGEVPSTPSRHVIDTSCPFTFTADIDLPSEKDLTRLRSDAFWELRKSIADSGEGLVRRMRDYEDYRSRADQHISRRRTSYRSRRERSSTTRRKSVGLGGSDPDIGTGGNDVDDDDDDDDDVQILSGTSFSSGEATHPRKKRALSLGPLDTSPFVSHGYPSPETTCDSSFTSDDDGDEFGHVAARGRARHLSAEGKRPSEPASVSYTPALSHTYSTSASSSLVSLPLPSPLQLTAEPQNPPPQRSSPLSWSSHPASRSEKAIAALTLAMANGVGGINDYHALLAIQGTSAQQGAEIGELWH